MEHEADMPSRAMLLTPPGTAAIAVVRLRGEVVGAFLQKHFSKVAAAGRCVHGTLQGDDRVIDDPVIALSDDGKTADINLHGGDWIVRECLDLAKRFGFEIVENCAELLDAENCLEREMLAALPLARTEQTIRALLAQPELWTKFIQETLQNNTPGLEVRVEISRMFEDESLWWMLHPPRVAIVGIPNVGKSTLANQLFGQQRSITADLPGTTRDWVGDWANLDGLPIHLLDTPGQRISSDAIEQAAIARSQKEIAQADLVILVLDPTQPKPPQELLLARHPHSLVVINKSDLASWQIRDAIQTVANRGAGLDRLQTKIRSHFAHPMNDSPHFWTSRQKTILQKARLDPIAIAEI
jgi:small GTP-binding protein